MVLLKLVKCKVFYTLKLDTINNNEVYITNKEIDLTVKYIVKYAELILYYFGDNHPNLEYINNVLV